MTCGPLSQQRKKRVYENVIVWSFSYLILRKNRDALRFCCNPNCLRRNRPLDAQRSGCSFAILGAVMLWGQRCETSGQSPHRLQAVRWPQLPSSRDGSDDSFPATRILSRGGREVPWPIPPGHQDTRRVNRTRSEERRVGKECR